MNKTYSSTPETNEIIDQLIKIGKFDSKAHVVRVAIMNLYKKEKGETYGETKIKRN